LELPLASNKLLEEVELKRLFELKIGSDSGPIDTESWLDFCLNNQQLRTLEINRDYEKIKTFQTIVENLPNLRFLIWQACFRKKAEEEKAIKLIGKNCKNLKFLVYHRPPKGKNIRLERTRDCKKW
jgi:hypothetical protein